MITIRRMTEADAPAVHDLISEYVAHEPVFGPSPVVSAALLSSQIRKGLQSWVAIEGGAIVGVLGPQLSGWRSTEKGEERSYHYYLCGVVDYRKTAAQALLVARDLSLFAVADTRAQGRLPDDIVIEGATACRGATWCRRVGCVEIDLGGGRSRFIVPVALLESRFKAVT